MKYRNFISIVILFLANGYIGISHSQTDDHSNATYLVDTSSSLLRVYVEKAGVLAAMGHNHVITFHEISGQFITAETAQQSSAMLQIAIDKSNVDDEQERKRAGAAYDSIPGVSARTGTRNNMNGPRVLDIARFPLVKVSITRSIDIQLSDMYEIILDFKGSTIILTLPAEVSITENNITVDSDFILTHEQLGLTPFTAAAGLLKVADEIRFQLHVEAVRN